MTDSVIDAANAAAQAAKDTSAAAKRLKTSVIDTTEKHRPKKRNSKPVLPAPEIQDTIP